MDIGDPFGFKKKHRYSNVVEKSKPSTFVKQIKDPKTHDLELVKSVISDIMKKEAKLKKSKHPLVHSPTQTKAPLIDFQIQSEPTKSPTQSEPAPPRLMTSSTQYEPPNPSEPPLESSVIHSSEIVNEINDNTMIKSQSKIDNRTDYDFKQIMGLTVATTATTNDSNMELENSIIDTDELLPLTSTKTFVDFDQNDGDDYTSELEPTDNVNDEKINVASESDADSEIHENDGSAHSIAAPILEIKDNITKVNSAIHKLERKISLSLKRELNHDSRKYKILRVSQKCLKTLKFPILGIVGGTGLYYMFQPYSSLVALISTNPAPFITSVLYSAITSIANTLIR